jgi:fatty-acyl-CoA synthase
METPVGQLRRAADTAPLARIHFGSEAVSYADLHERSLRVAGGLKAIGVRPGDRIAFWLPNSLPYLDLLYACQHLGAISVAINTRFRRAEAESILQRTGATGIVLWPDFKGIPFLDMLAELDPGAVAALRFAVLCEAQRAEFPIAGVQAVLHTDLLSAETIPSAAKPALPAAIFATSGTTSAPKFALHRHGRIAEHAQRVAAAFGFTDPDAHLFQAVPFCGIWGFSQWVATVAAGASATLTPLFEPREAGELIRARQITHLSGPDDLLKRLLDAFPEEKPFPSVREALFASFNPTLTNFVEEADRRGLRTINGFGMSEIFSFFSRQKAQESAVVRKLPGGFPLSPTTQIRVRDLDGDELLPPGAVGRLEIKSDTMFAGYFNDPAATEAAFTEDGFFRTGDLASMEADGSFRLKGRNGDFLRLGGFLVNPNEIELVLQKATGGADVVVVEAATERGNKVVAFVRATGGAPLDEATLDATARTMLADYKVPSRYVALREFPVAMSANGEKIQRRRLKEMAAELMAS